MVKNATKDIDVRRELFDILVDHVILGPLRLKECRNENVSPHVYDRFIGDLAMFPHHD